VQASMPGFWEPHSSSIEFCEPNYVLSHYIAEAHNTWSSLFIVVFGIIGLLYSNVSNEWRNFALYGAMTICGIGSVCLHGTLHWAFQSADELPMLWGNLAFIFSLSQMNNMKDESSFVTASLFILMGLLQTYLYFTYRHILGVFLVMYGLGVVLVLYWLGASVTAAVDKAERDLRYWLFTRSLFSYVIVGFALWSYEMHHCEHLEPHFLAWGGASFHILWHFGAALGTYLMILQCVVCRAQALGMLIQLDWIFGGIFPIAMSTGRRKMLS
jgi:dihydroceramidase